MGEWIDETWFQMSKKLGLQLVHLVKYPIRVDVRSFFQEIDYGILGSKDYNWLHRKIEEDDISY